MRMSALVGRCIRENPRDAVTASHKFLIRGGYIRPVSAGIYSLLPLGKKVVDKVEAIIREEMNAIGGQEVLLPVVLPADLWKESGRYESVAEELLRFKDRNGRDMLLGMTHEEAVVHLVRSEVNSYKQLPVMLYQIQTKYRDEARPRAGLIRVREFTMKDAYSFHASQECLEKYYEKAHRAYVNIFRRVGLKDVVPIKSDSGMMGGKVSHEFMALADCGEDTIFCSPDASYMANRDVATSSLKFEKEEALELEKVHTPGKKTIEEVAAFLGITPDRTGKAVFYADSSASLVFVVIRGDFEVNETKLKNYIRSPELRFATDEEIRSIGSEPGFASPLSVDRSKVRVVFDHSAAESSNLVVGANEADYHYRNFNFDRDIGDAEVIDLATVREGDPCPETGEPLQIRRGIEVGNIFQLGTKYSETMNCSYLSKDGKSFPMIMGCYGVGVGRTAAAVIEQSHDDWGPVWPLPIAPFQVHLCALNPDRDSTGDHADKLYDELLAKGIDVLYDDRGEKAGFMFSEADLIGIPFRLTVSPKTLKSSKVEFKRRGEKEFQLTDIDAASDMMLDMIEKEMEKYR